MSGAGDSAGRALAIKPVVQGPDTETVARRLGAVERQDASRRETSEARGSTLRRVLPDLPSAGPPARGWERDTGDAVRRPATGLLRPGRFEGGDGQARIDLRVDAEEPGWVSGDIFRRGADGDTWVASFRLAPGVSGALGRTLAIVAEDRYGVTAQGTVLLEDDTGLLLLRLMLYARLDGLPYNRPIVMALAHAGPGMRRLGLEIERETGVDPLPAVPVDGVPISLEAVLAAAGYDVSTAGTADILPPAPSDGWGEKSLIDLMEDFAQSDISAPGFALRVLLLSRSNRPGLLGIMFDHRDEMPRQGCAVFAHEIIDRVPQYRQATKLLQTTVHEIGHALNLVHRFERAVGKADSLSPMNYDWRFGGGDRVADYWRDFRFRFDPDELGFLRHGTWRATVPGGSDFHSARYWAEGDGGYSPYVPERPLPGWELSLVEPVSGPVFAFGQPVVLGVRLTNRTGQALRVPGILLDTKAGFLEILIERESGKGGRRGEPHAFHAIMHRCFDIEEMGMNSVLAPNGMIEDNVHLHFGMSGFAFAEPGNYCVTAVLGVPSGTERAERITRSQSLRLRISMPRTREEENEALTLFDERIGLYLALGGTDRLDDAIGGQLEEVVARRTRRTSSGFVRDPLAVHITRARGFNASRAAYRLREGKIHPRLPRIEEAVKLFATLDRRSLSCFDCSTREKTMVFKTKLEAAVAEDERGRLGAPTRATPAGDG